MHKNNVSTLIFHVYVLSASDRALPPAEPRTQPVAVALPDGDPIAGVALGNRHALLVGASGRLFAFGDNSFGQLGLSDEHDSSSASSASSSANPNAHSRPRHVNAFGARRVVAAACGERHSMVLCSDGAVYTFGSGDTQQLGHCTAAEVAAATQLALTDAAASRHAIAQWSADCAVPRLVPAVPLGAVAIAVGATVSAAITSNGDVLMWGFGVDTPVPAQQPHVRDKPMALVALGGADWTVYVTRPPRDVHFLEFDAIAALDSDQSAEMIQVPPLAPAAAFRGLSVARASMSVASESFGGAVLADGRALMWGENGSHQLGAGDTQQVAITAPRELALFHSASSSAPKSLLLSHLACGAEHSVALTRAGVVCAFGAGMFGRLGVEPRSEADAPRPRAVRALLPSSSDALASDEADAIDAAFEASQPPHAHAQVKREMEGFVRLH